MEIRWLITDSELCVCEAVVGVIGACKKPGPGQPKEGEMGHSEEGQQNREQKRWTQASFQTLPWPPG